MIQEPESIAGMKKKVRILIAGYPGIGKSTLGLSAPRALHIDVDKGVDRVEPRYRRPFIQPDTYDVLLGDLKPDNLKNFDTLVFDTGGRLIRLIGYWAVKQDAKNAKKDGALSLQGYGAVGREFERLMDYCAYELDKNIVVLFHAKEEKDGEETKLRIIVEGQTKDNVWQPMDLGGFMEMRGDSRTLGLTNCERYYAKGTRGIKGIVPIPELKDDSPNDFLTKLFALYNSKNADEVKAQEEKNSEYEAAMAAIKKVVDGVTDAESANNAIPQMKAIKHVLTSETEGKTLFKAKIEALGIAWDRATKLYKKVEANG
jgi:hypothetical protein